MNYIRHLTGFFERTESDMRMTAYHISLYLALFQLWNLNRFRNPFPISREELMHISRIGSKNTYARCIQQLDQWGYISYFPNGNLHTGRQVSCTRFDIEIKVDPGTTSGTRTETGTRTRDGTRTGTRSGTPFINNTNYNKQHKQKPNKIFDNGERRKYNGFGRFHVSTDKDYTEPL
jgi:hypothetical protein